MKTKPASLAAFFHPRFLLSFAFCLTGLLLALISFSSGGTARAERAQQKNPSAESSSSATQPFAPLGGPTLAGQLIISEFRQRGLSGANDEFIDLYNNTSDDLTIQSADGSPGLAVVASDGVPRCIVPNGTVMPYGRHFLCTNSVSYSLSGYPSGSGSTATGDLTYTLEIPDSGGLAIFNNSTGGASFSVANRIDAVGTTTVAALYREGAGLPVLQPFSVDYSWVRRLPGGCITGLNCATVALLSTSSGPTSTMPQDTNNNVNDFIFQDTNATSAGGGQRLGAPGPQNQAGPGNLDLTLSQGPNIRQLDPCAFETSPPNYVRDATSAPANNATFGTIDIRKTFINRSIYPVTRLRFRIVDITTYPAISGAAELRPSSSGDVTATVDRVPCGSGFSNVTVHGTTLEQPPNQPNGGGYNSSLSVDAVSPANPVGPGGSIDVRFLIGSEVDGLARFCVLAETIPASTDHVSCFTPVDITPESAPNCASTIFSEDFEGVQFPNLPAGWVSTFSNGEAQCPPSGSCTGGNHWSPAGGEDFADTGSVLLYHNDPNCVTDATLDSPTIPITAPGAQLTFRNEFITESGFDGCVLEISSPNISGGAFTDILAAGGSFVSGGYNQAISSNFLSPIAGRQAWSGKSVDYITTRVNLPAAVTGQTIRLRFRIATDCSVGIIDGGWRIDTVRITAGVCQAQALNISTRMQVQTGNNVLIGGFIVTGNTTKKVALRGIGPSLAGSGVPDPLADPTLELHNSSGALIAQNDNWQDDPAQATQLTNLGIAPTDPNESGLVVTLQPSAGYTAILAGKNGGTGVGLVEVYDVNAATGSQLANISTRGPVQSGSNVMIGGFILGGSGNSRVVVRGLGPSLGVNPVLADPTLELHDGNGATLIANDNWQDDPASAAQLTAFGLALSNPNESGIFTSLPPGNFTAIVAGKNGGTGIGLVEVYNIN